MTEIGYVMRKGRRIAVENYVSPGMPKPRKKKRDFVMTTRTQIELLCTARHHATVKVFLYLQLLIFKSYTKSVRLPNAALARYKIGRTAKQVAVCELERMGLIRVTRFRHRSPEVVILDLPDKPQ